jgi:hypothetical protein
MPPPQLHCVYDDDFAGNERQLEIYSHKYGVKLLTITISNGFVDIFDEMENKEHTILEVTDSGTIVNNLVKL